MRKPRKAKLITPFFMLLAGAITSIVLYARGVDFLTMLLTLLIVVLVFYFIGDVIRYIYEMVQPRVIAMDDYSYYIDENGHVVERTVDEEEQQEEEEVLQADEDVAKDASTDMEMQAEANVEAFAEEDFVEDDEYSEEDLAEQM